MNRNLIIEDYITPVREILSGCESGRRSALHKLIYRGRKINRVHLQGGYSVEQTVDEIMSPSWREGIKGFSYEHWRALASEVQFRAASLLGSVPVPHIILYPGFRTMNGRVYKVDRQPVIGCSPDFPGSRGINLRVLLAHEYAHFIRWRKMGIPCENVPIYALIYEEGWAVWLTAKLLPEPDLSRVFMVNLHGAIDMPDPERGYFLWCRKYLGTLVNEALPALRSRDEKEMGRFFQCQRFRGNDTPIRTGYYLGYKMLQYFSREMSPKQLLRFKPTRLNIESALRELHASGDQSR